MTDLLNIFDLPPRPLTPREQWAEDHAALLQEFRAYGLRFDTWTGRWERLPGTPEPPGGLVVPLPPLPERSV